MIIKSVNNSSWDFEPDCNYGGTNSCLDGLQIREVGQNLFMIENKNFYTNAKTAVNPNFCMRPSIYYVINIFNPF